MTDQRPVVVISGGTDGLGLATARQLRSDCQVVILAPDATKVQHQAAELDCLGLACDVSDCRQVAAVITQILETYETIDCLINNAGIWIEGKLEDNDPAQIERVFAVNALGTIYLTRAVIPQMKKQQNGRIIQVISQGGLYGKAKRSVYTAAKFAITGFTKSLQDELAGDGITVTGFYPGKMETKLFEKEGIAKDFSDAMSVEAAAQALHYLVMLPADLMVPEFGLKRRGN